MKLTPDELRRIAAVLDADTNGFTRLAEIAGLRPGSDFLGADLRNVDFGTDDLSGFEFWDADVTGADFSKAHGLRWSMFVGADYDETTRWPQYLPTDR